MKKGGHTQSHMLHALEVDYVSGDDHMSLCLVQIYLCFGDLQSGRKKPHFNVELEKQNLIEMLKTGCMDRSGNSPNLNLGKA